MIQNIIIFLQKLKRVYMLKMKKKIYDIAAIYSN